MINRLTHLLKTLLSQLETDTREGCIPTGVICMLLGVGGVALGMECVERHIYIAAIPAGVLAAGLVGLGMVMLLSCFVRE